MRASPSRRRLRRIRASLADTSTAAHADARTALTVWRRSQNRTTRARPVPRSHPTARPSRRARRAAVDAWTGTNTRLHRSEAWFHLSNRHRDLAAGAYEIQRGHIDDGQRRGGDPARSRGRREICVTIRRLRRASETHGLPSLPFLSREWPSTAAKRVMRYPNSPAMTGAAAAAPTSPANCASSGRVRGARRRRPHSNGFVYAWATAAASRADAHRYSGALSVPPKTAICRRACATPADASRQLSCAHAERTPRNAGSPVPWPRARGPLNRSVPLLPLAWKTPPPRRRAR